jgi:hypothetical protein
MFWFSDIPIGMFTKSMALCLSMFGKFHLNTARCAQLYGQMYWNNWVCFITNNIIRGVMVSMFSSCVIDRGFQPNIVESGIKHHNPNPVCIQLQ